MRKTVVIAEVACFAVAAILGCIYSDRLNRERELKEHIEAVGAQTLSIARELQGKVQRFSSELDSRLSSGEEYFASATNKMAGLRQRWGESTDEKVRQILAEAESGLAEEEQKLVAAREAKARVMSVLDSLSADLAEIEGMTIADEATLRMVSQRVVGCSDSFSAVRRSPDNSVIVRGSIRMRADFIVMEASHRIWREPRIIRDPAPQTAVDHLLDERENYIASETIESVMVLHVLKTLQWEKFKGRLLEGERTVTKDKYKALLRDAIFRIDLMESIHKLLVANVKGFAFRKSKLKGCEVLSSDESGMRLFSTDKKREECITWQVFYARYHANLNELVVGLIEKARATGKTADGVGFDDESWASAMLGAALSFVHICGDDPTAHGRAEQLAKAAVIQCPTIRAEAKRAFPTFSFDKEDDD